MMTDMPESIYLYVNEKDKLSMRAFTWTEEEFHTPSTKYTRADTERVKVLEDALYEIIDQVESYTGCMPMMVREISEQALTPHKTEEES